MKYIARYTIDCGVSFHGKVVPSIRQKDVILSASSLDKALQKAQYEQRKLASLYEPNPVKGVAAAHLRRLEYVYFLQKK